MALYMFFHVLPDTHIDFLMTHPQTFRAYMEGRIPEVRKSLIDKLLGRTNHLKFPVDWPEKELEGYCPEINHRQVEYFHYLLNGTHKRVAHSGAIFQTWFAPGHSSVAIPLDGENFALKSQEVLTLKERLNSISEDMLFSRYQETVDQSEIDDTDKEFLVDAFHTISSACDKAIHIKHGLMWTAG